MVYYIENDNLIVGVKDFGAELTSVKSKKSGFEFMWQGDPSVWSGQSPVLFPIIGRLLDDKYYFNGEEFKLEKHGFFRKRHAELANRADGEITFIQTDGEDTIGKYPFKFNIFITFSIRDNSITVSHKVKNINDKTMYFSLGAHPAFRCEVGDILRFDMPENLDTVSIDRESIRLEKTTPLLRNERDIVITKNIFDNDALILSNIKSERISLINQGFGERVKFTFGNCPYLGIWAKPGASYVCIEPWWGINDSRVKKADLSQKDGIQSLEAGETFEACWTAEFFG
ncbi:MAG: aldose 1-epimerase family protein [Clostridiales bacterium]|nr:aldose 1-epimerase family protein [Clostridiales bacterium]